MEEERIPYFHCGQGYSKNTNTTVFDSTFIMRSIQNMFQCL